jgi:hypothetical protein
MPARCFVDFSWRDAQALRFCRIGAQWLRCYGYASKRACVAERSDPVPPG